MVERASEGSHLQGVSYDLKLSQSYVDVQGKCPLALC